MRPELPTAVAVDNSASIQPARSIFISWGKSVQISGATSESKLLRLKDVSKLTSLGQSTINLWVAQGKFPKPKALSMTIKVWRMKDVISWIDKQYDDESNHENTLHESTPALRIVNS